MTRTAMNIFSIFECYFIFFGIVGVIATEETGHSWSDLVKSFLHKDFYYVLGEYLYGSSISYNYPDQIFLRVGKKWEKDIGSSGHEVECERASEKDFYQFDTTFVPNLHIYGDENGVANKNILSYFTFIEREIWICTSRLPRGICKKALRNVGVKMKSSEPISFYRIVNVMHGIKPINKIFYFDGIEVFVDRCAVRQEDDMGDHYTATFREVKYFDPSDKKVVRYKGEVFLKKDPTSTTQTSIFEPIDVSKEQPYNKEKIKIEDLDFLENGTSKTQNIGSEGRILRVGIKHYEIIGSANDEAICKLVGADRNGAVCHAKDLPFCALKKRRKDITEFYSTFGDDGLKQVNTEYFSVTRQELWECKYADDKVFGRRLTELVGSIPIEKMEYHSGISVWKYRLDSSTYSVKIREIFYYEPNSKSVPVKFGGVVKLMKPNKRHHEIELDKHSYKYNNIGNQMPTRLYPDYDDDSDDDILDMGAAVI